MRMCVGEREGEGERKRERERGEGGKREREKTKLNTANFSRFVWAFDSLSN